MKRVKCKIIVKELQMVPTEFGDQITDLNWNDIKLLYKDFNVDLESAQVQISGLKTFLVLEATPKATQQQLQKNLQILPTISKR